MRTKSAIFALALLLISGNAQEEGIQAQCGAEAGRAFAVEGGAIQTSDAGWYEDSTHGETVVRIDIATGDVDLRFRDATGTWQSVEDQGGSVSLFGANDPSWLVHGCGGISRQHN